MNLRSTTAVIAAALVAVPLGAALPASTKPIQIRAESLPFVRNMDERFQSFQLGFSHLTGGEVLSD